MLDPFHVKQKGPIHSAKVCLEDLLRTSLKDVLWTSPYGPLSNTKGRPLLASTGLPLPTFFQRWNMTSWGRPNVTSSVRCHNVVYVTPRDVLCRHLEVVSCRRYEDVSIWSNLYLQWVCIFIWTNLYQLPEDVLKTSLYGCIIKAKKHPRGKDFCTWS